MRRSCGVLGSSSMRWKFWIVAAIACGIGGQQAFAQGDAETDLPACKKGAPVEVRGLFYKVEDGGLIQIEDHPAASCAVQYIDPKGKMPGECKEWVRISASGTIRIDREEYDGETQTYSVLEGLKMLKCESADALAPPGCKHGDVVTVTGTVKTVATDRTVVPIVPGKAKGACPVTEIYFLQTPPASCAKNSLLTAKGAIDASIVSDGSLNLALTKLQSFKCEGGENSTQADISEDCDLKIDDGDRLIKACTQLIDGLGGAAGRGSDDMVLAKVLLTRSAGWKMKGDIGRALADVERAIGLTPDVSGGYYFRGKIYVEQKEYDRALPDLDKAVALDHQESSDIFYARGWAFEHKGDKDRARADYRKALAIDADHQGAQEGLARLAADSRAPTGASADARKACESYGNADLTIDGCTQLIAKNVENLPDIYTKRGNGYRMKKDYDRAIADYDKAIEIDPSYSLAYSLRGLAYAGKGEHDRAIADYDKALLMRPYIVTYLNRGKSYFAKGDYDRALADYNKALELDPADPEAYCGRGDAYKGKGDEARATDEYRAAERIEGEGICD